MFYFSQYSFFHKNAQEDKALHWMRRHLRGAAEIYAPGNLVSDTFPNAAVKTIIKDLLVILQEKIVIKRKEQLCVFLVTRDLKTSRSTA